MWKAHGLPVERKHGLWFCAEETPQFYPNVVTVDPASDPETQAGLIQELAQRSNFDFSVKDSFACLPLAAAGLNPLFSATWLWLEPGGAKPPREEVTWRRVEAGNLKRWERAWRGDDATHARTFPDQLLDNARVHIIGGFDAEDQIVAGGIAYEAASVIGLTNVFGPRGQVMAALVSLLTRSPIVAYKAGGDLAAAKHHGFDPVGQLTVWAGGSS